MVGGPAQNFEAAAGPAMIAVSWDPTAGGVNYITAYYRVQVRTGANAFATPAAGTCATTTLAATNLACTITGLTNDTAYDVRIVAMDRYGAGSWSATLSATPKAALPTMPSAAPSLTAGNQQITVSWTAVTEGSERVSGQAAHSGASPAETQAGAVPDGAQAAAEASQVQPATVTGYSVQYRTGTSAFAAPHQRHLRFDARVHRHVMHDRRADQSNHLRGAAAGHHQQRQRPVVAQKGGQSARHARRTSRADDRAGQPQLGHGHLDGAVRQRPDHHQLQAPAPPQELQQQRRLGDALRHRNDADTHRLRAHPLRHLRVPGGCKEHARLRPLVACRRGQHASHRRARRPHRRHRHADDTDRNDRVVGRPGERRRADLRRDLAAPRREHRLVGVTGLRGRLHVGEPVHSHLQDHQLHHLGQD